MSDTHLGFRLRGTHPDAGGSIPPWSYELRPNLAFSEALSTAIVRGVDAVIHTGDLFDHNVDRSSIEGLRSMLTELHETGIPFYCILGDHDRGATGGAFPGDVDAIAVLAELVEAGLVTLLDTDPTYVGTVALYGIDATSIGLDEIRDGGYELDFWENPDISFGTPIDETRPALCLHERTAPPYKPNENPTCEFDHHLPGEPDFDLFAVGHEHSPAKTCSWNGAMVTYSGPTQRFSKGWPDLVPSVSLIEIPPEGEISIDHISLSAGSG
jgi:DNA repair exonuclease SbcCD nuclease subunit